MADDVKVRLSAEGVQDVIAAFKAVEASATRMSAEGQKSFGNLTEAQREFAKQVTSTTEAFRLGTINSEEYTARITKLRAELASASKGLNEHGAALGLNRAQYLTAQSAVLRFSDSVMAGQSPLRAMALEAHKVVEVLSLDNGGMAGGLAKVAGLINPVTVGIAAFAAVVIAAVTAAIQYNERLNQMEAATTGFGRASELTGETLIKTAEANAAAGKLTVGAAEEIETAILRQTRTSEQALGQVIKITQKFADAMGIDTKKAAEELGKALGDPAKAADELASKYGYLTQAQVEEIHQLMENNRLLDAQKVLLDNLGHELDNAGDHVSALTRNFRSLKATVAGLWDDLGSAITRGYEAITNQQDKATKAAALQKQIFADMRLLQMGSGNLPDPNRPDQTRAVIEARLKAEQAQYAQLARNDGGSDARGNQLGAQARSITAKYGLDPTVAPKLEALKQDLSTLTEAQRNGQHVDAATIEGLRHAIRTFMTPEQQKVAIEGARSDIRKYQRGTPEWQAAQQRYADARTAGEVISEDSARKIEEDRAAGFRPSRNAAAAADRMAREQTALKEAQLEGELKIYQAHSALELAIDKQRYDQGEIALKEYFDKRRAITEGEYDREEKILRERMAAIAAAPAAKDPAEKVRREVEIAKLQADLDAKADQRKRALAQIETERGAEQRRVLDAQQSADVKLLQIEGKKTEAAKEQLEIELRKLEIELQKSGKSGAEIKGAMDAARTQGTAKIDYNDKAQDLATQWKQLDNQIAAIKAKLADGKLFPFQAEQQILAAERARLPVLQRITSELQAQARATGDEGLAAAADAQKEKTDQLGASTDKVGEHMKNLKQTAQESLTNGLANALDDIILKSKNVGDAFKGMALAFAEAIIKMEIEAVAARAVKALMGGGFSGGGAVHAATGGYITGPGTSTSDSIPARLSDGEFVVNAKAVAQPGMRELLHAINGSPGYARTSRAGVAAFASGGMVQAAGGGNTYQRVDASGIDPKIIHDAVRKTVLDVIAKNPAHVRSAIA
jgi:hypothetical protein